MTRAKDISKILTDADLSGTLDVTGKVGILGTNDLGVGLHIKEGDSGVTSVSTDADQLVIENNAESGISLLAPTNSASRIAFGDSDNNKIGMIYYNHSSNFLKFDVNNAEAMRIDSSGNLLVGATSSNSGAFGAVSPQILVAGSIPQVALHETDTDKDGYIGISSSTMFIQTADSIPIRFGTSDAERMRIDSGGVTHFGGTSSINDATGAGSVNITSLSTALEVYRTSTGGNTICQMFSNEGSTKSNRFGFKANGGLSNYSANDTNLSDEREKTDIELSKDYLAIINAIPVKTFKYIDHSSDEPSLGVIAQDVQAVAPELVNEEDWGTIENPKIRLSVFTTDMQFAMMKAIQELSAKNDALETANTALEARITALETA